MPIEKKEKTKTIKKCICGATVFQGPFQRGPIVDGMQIVRETLYQRVNCNRVDALEKFEDFPIES